MIVLAVTLALRGPVAELTGLYGIAGTLRPLAVNDSLILIGFSAAMGWLGAALSLLRHLREPS